MTWLVGTSPPVSVVGMMAVGASPVGTGSVQAASASRARMDRKNAIFFMGFLPKRRIVAASSLVEISCLCRCRKRANWFVVFFFCKLRTKPARYKRIETHLIRQPVYLTCQIITCPGMAVKIKNIFLAVGLFFTLGDLSGLFTSRIVAPPRQKRRGRQLDKCS